MKKNLYLWIFIAVAIVLCGTLFFASVDVFKKGERENSALKNIPNSSRRSEGKNVVSEKVDLTQPNVDFEEDNNDLNDGIADDASFDDQPSVDSIENEVY
ncbi:MAG: hypothetical protein WC682_03715 [Parcubacteria group bacterium]|jgi:hypothetical protein